MSESILSVKNIEVAYGQIVAVRGVSFELPESSIVVALGSNGAGKSTMLKAISGLMEASKGTIEFERRQIQNLSPDKIARSGISLVPEGREVFPLMTVADNLRVASYSRGRDIDLEQELVTVFDYFPSLVERKDQLASRLSGGEQQMLAIGRGMMMKPRLLLLDEPSLGLSPKLVKDIFKIIQRLNQEWGMTILLVEQNAKAAFDIADHGFVLETGRIVQSGTRDYLVEREDIQEFYLGVKSTGVRGKKRWKRTKTWR